MGKRTWIDSDFWIDTEDLSDADRLLYLRLLTQEQRNKAGYYKLNVRYMAFDMGITEKELEERLSKEQKYWMYDKDTKQVLIPRFTRYNLVRSDKQIKSMCAELSKLKPCSLDGLFLKAFEECNGIGALALIDEKFKERASWEYE